MKKLILLYSIALLFCFAFAFICSLISFYSWWYVFLLIFPISLGWLPYSMIIGSVSPSQIRDAGCFLVALSVVFIVLLSFALYTIGHIFWGQTCVVFFITAVISTIFLIFKIGNKN